MNHIKVYAMIKNCLTSKVVKGYAGPGAIKKKGGGVPWGKIISQSILKRDAWAWSDH